MLVTFFWQKKCWPKNRCPTFLLTNLFFGHTTNFGQQLLMGQQIVGMQTIFENKLCVGTTHNICHSTNIAYYRLNWPRGRCSEKLTKYILVFIIILRDLVQLGRFYKLCWNNEVTMKWPIIFLQNLGNAVASGLLKESEALKECYHH